MSNPAVFVAEVPVRGGGAFGSGALLEGAEVGGDGAEPGAGLAAGDGYGGTTNVCACPDMFGMLPSSPVNPE